jgi:hypothetical protein
MSRYKKFRSPPRVFLHTHTNTQTKSQTTSFFPPALFSLSHSLIPCSTASLSHPITSLKGMSLALFIPMYTHSTPRMQREKSLLDGNCTLMQSRKKVRASNDVFMAKGNRPFKYNLIGQLDSKLPAGCFTSPLTLCGGVYASGFDIVHQSA